MLSYILPVEEKPSATTTTTTTGQTTMAMSPPISTLNGDAAIRSLQVQQTPVSIVKVSSGLPTAEMNTSNNTTTAQQMRNLNLNLNLNNKLNQSGGGGYGGLLSAIIENNTTINNSDDNDDDGCHSIENCDENTKLLVDSSSKSSASTSVLDSAAVCLHGSNHNSNRTSMKFTSNGNGNNNNVSSNNSSLKGGDSCHSCIEEEEIPDTCDEDTETGGTSDGDRRKQLKKVKLSKMGGGTGKSVTLKRVSFGSSKGSMVETLVFETPTPLPEHAEREFGFSVENAVNGMQSICNNNVNTSCSRINTSLDDSGIELQEELERSKVRVSIYQSSQPQQVSPPESYSQFKDNSYLLISDSFSTEPSDFDDIMTAVTATPTSYDRQQSTDSGWDNPFRPGGDLSREADEIVNMIKGGKPITPTGDINHAISNGSAQKDSHSIENGTAVVDGATKIQVAQSQSAAQNGTNSPQLRPATTTTTVTAAAGGGGGVKTTSAANGVSDANGTTTQTQVSNKVVPGPTSASHVIIDDKKNKKKGCCVIQ